MSKSKKNTPRSRKAADLTPVAQLLKDRNARGVERRKYERRQEEAKAQAKEALGVIECIDKMMLGALEELVTAPATSIDDVLIKLRALADDQNPVEAGSSFLPIRYFQDEYGGEYLSMAALRQLIKDAEKLAPSIRVVATFAKEKQPASAEAGA